MGFLSRLFGKGDAGEKKPEPDKQMRLPYETLIVPGADAVAACLRLRQEGAGRFTPVILGNPKEVAFPPEAVDTDGNSPQMIIRLSEAITMRSFTEKRLAEDADYYGSVELGEWPEKVKPSPDLTGLIGHTDILKRRQPLKQVAICKVPTPRSWETPAYLLFGGWNECPMAEEQVALLRYWNEKYGADVITITNDILECTVSRPPTEREQALELAREQFMYCSDIVYQGTNSLSSLAATLCGGKTWYFWWD